jgi:serine protease Do
MNKPTRILLLIACLVLIRPAVAFGTESTTQRVALPIAEVVTILKAWLVRAGFDVQDAVFAMGARQLAASKTNESWIIDLKPSSALATDMDARYTGSTPDEAANVDQLSQYLAAYLDASMVNQEDSNRAIPVEVLSRIRSAVCIEAAFENQTTQHSGFVVDTEGLVMCTTHGLKGLEEIRVILYDGRKLNGTLVRIDKKKDLALIQVAAGLESAVSLTSGRNLLGMGERVYSVGCPVNLIGTVYSGIINGPPRRVERMPFWQVSMEIYPGSSGSPVFDGLGNLVGIVKGRYRGTQSIGFLIPLETIIAFIKES